MLRCCFQRLTFLLRCVQCRRGLAMRILSVRLPNACIVTKRKKDLSRFLNHTKYHLAQFSEKNNGLEGATPSTWNSGSAGPRWSEISHFEPIFARNASAVTPMKKVQLTRTSLNRTSTTRFPVSVRWSSYVAPKPPKGAQKHKTADFRLKSYFAWRKSATKFPCVKTASGKVVRHLIH